MRHTLVYSLRGLAFVRVRLWLTLNMSFGKSSQSQKYPGNTFLFFPLASHMVAWGRAESIASQEPKNLSFLPFAVKEVDPSHFVRSVLLLYLKMYTHNLHACFYSFSQTTLTRHRACFASFSRGLLHLLQSYLLTLLQSMSTLNRIFVTLRVLCIYCS